jgi:hypothetical protein
MPTYEKTLLNQITSVDLKTLLLKSFGIPFIIIILSYDKLEIIILIILNELAFTFS